MDYSALIKSYLQKGSQLAFLSVVTATSLMAEIKWQFAEMIYTKIEKKQEKCKGKQVHFLFCHYLLITTYVVASFLLSSVKDWDISHILYFPPWSYIMISNLGSVLLLTTMVVRSSKSLLPMLSLSDWKASCGDDDERSLQHPWPPPPPFYKYACTL